MITTAKIIKYVDDYLLLLPDESISRKIFQTHVGNVEIRLNDGRSISADQRKKIFAIIRDIALWNGDDPEFIRQFMTWEFICKNNLKWFSLSDVDMTIAKEFINHLIEFCFLWNVQTRDTMLNHTDDIGKYLYHCLEYRKCAICNAHAEVHHVNRIGMGANREKVVHIGIEAIALCRKHHDEAHWGERDLFNRHYIYGIKLDDYLCKCLSLNYKAEEVRLILKLPE